MLQSSFSDGVAFDLFSLQYDGLAASEVDVGRRQVRQAFVITAVIVVLDEAPDVGRRGQYGSFLQQSTACGSPAGYRGRAARTVSQGCWI